MKIFDSEIKLMEIIWRDEPVSAKAVSLAAEKEIGWNKNTTYTVLKKLIDKGYVRREEPGFVCSSLITRGAETRSEGPARPPLFRLQKGAVFGAAGG